MYQKSKMKCGKLSAIVAINAMPAINDSCIGLMCIILQSLLHIDGHYNPNRYSTALDSMTVTKDYQKKLLYFLLTLKNDN